ncbi:MAG: hypothetical protein ACYDDI_14545 [Candidatus Acidiferrales bacterium]
MLFMAVLSGCAAAHEGKKPDPPGSIAVTQSTSASTAETVKAVEAQEKKSEPCEKRTYKLTLMANGFYMPPDSTATQDRGFWGSMNYASADGSRIAVYRTDFRSSEAALKAFHATVDGAARVLERGPVRGHERPADSDRVMLMILGKDDQKYFSVVWLEGKYLRSIVSSSLQDLKDFEETVEFNCK